MTDFRRLPDWQLHADRHTELTDPVLTVRQLSRFEFTTRKPMTRFDHALVLVTSKGLYDTYLPPHRPSRTDVVGKRYTAMYEVDLGIHPVRAELALPSADDAFEFTTTVELTWQVADAERFVRSGHRDVPALLVGEVHEATQQTTRAFTIGRSAEAEAAVLQALGMHRPLGESAGLRVTWSVRLRRDAESIAHQRRLQQIDHSAAEGILSAQRGGDQDTAEDQRQRLQDTLAVGRATEYGKQQQELTLRQQQWEHEQALARAQYALEMQEYQRKQIAYYEHFLERGDVAAFALQLAERPEDIALVLGNLREDRHRLVQSRLKVVMEMLTSKNVESYQLEGASKTVLQFVDELFGNPEEDHSAPRAEPAAVAAPTTEPEVGGPTEQAEPPAPSAQRTSGYSAWKPPPGYGATAHVPPPAQPAPPQPPARDDS